MPNEIKALSTFRKRHGKFDKRVCMFKYYTCKFSYDFQYYKTYKMVYSIDSTHLNYGHVYSADL